MDARVGAGDWGTGVGTGECWTDVEKIWSWGRPEPESWKVGSGLDWYKTGPYQELGTKQGDLGQDWGLG